MQEWTEQQEQQMIALAREGDPKANYELSLWALRRSEEEPDESRWNRLAAKCLVKSAQAGYGPAQERMDQLLHQSREGASPARQEPEPEPEPEPEQPAPRKPVLLSDARAAAEARRSRGPAPESTARHPSRYPFRADDEDEEEPEDEDDLNEDDYDEDDAPADLSRLGSRRSRPARPARPARDADVDDDYPAGGGSAAATWGERQWRRVEFICVAICAALLVLIAVMIITSRSGGNSGTNPNSAIPPAADANVADTDTTPTPEPEQYPDDATLAKIAAADLEVFPADTDYVTAPTTATVKVDSQSLRLRKGPSTTYTPPICSMEDGTTVEVYAIKNNWSLVYYEGGEDGPVYGWCSSEYLIVTAGAADSSSVG